MLPCNLNNANLLLLVQGPRVKLMNAISNISSKCNVQCMLRMYLVYYYNIIGIVCGVVLTDHATNAVVC